MRDICADPKATVRKLELDTEQLTGSKLGKEYKDVYYHPAYLTYMQCVCVCVCARAHAQLLNCVQLFATPWIGACQAP